MLGVHMLHSEDNLLISLSLIELIKCILLKFKYEMLNGISS